MDKRYLGNGLYVEIQAPDWIIITSEDGVNVLARLVFDVEMVTKLKQMVNEYMAATDG